MVGNFNCVTHIQLDKLGGDDSFGNRAVTQLHTLTDSLKLEDFYRVQFPIQLDTALTANDQHRCEGELTLNECLEAVSQLSSNKSPGSDGLPVQFYRCFWSLLGPDLVAIQNYSYTYGSLSNTQRRGIIRLLFKKDDPLELKNWPPISLLNTDYTICMKVLANRLCNVLPRIINKDQRCGIPYHSIYENLFLLRDTIDYVQHKHLLAAIISLDQEKAFDRLNHKLLHRVLTRFNFGPLFRRRVNVVYTDITSNVSKIFFTVNFIYRPVLSNRRRGMPRTAPSP